MSEEQDPKCILEPAFIATLIEKYVIPEERVERFSSELERCCRRFLERQVDSVQLGTVAKQRKALSKITSKVNAFEEFLNNIPLPLKDMMAEANDQMNGERFNIECEAYEADFNAGELSGFHPTPPNKNEVFMNVPLVLNQLKLLAGGAKFAEQVSLKKKEKHQPPFRKPLDYWIIDMRSLWSGTLGRQFTRDQAKGGAVSPAAEFCVDVIAKLSKGTLENDILTAMRNLAEATDEPTYWRKLHRFKRKTANVPKGQ